MDKLEWMVIQELFETETASFWKRPGVDPASIQTEVFLLPAADALEKAGSIVTSGRLIQWRTDLAKAPGEAREDIWILDRIYRELKRLYGAGGNFPDPIVNLHWDFGDPIDVEKVALEISGYYTQDVEEHRAGDMVSGFGALLDNGATACGNWLYSGYFFPDDDGEGNKLPRCQRRGTEDPGGLGIYPYWGFVWPVNRHIIYNRCSADTKGQPWAPDKALVWWDPTKGENGEWTGYDVPDFGRTKDPTGAGGDDAFIMLPFLKGTLFGSLNEGPFPEHYEPVESPVNNLMSSQQINPVITLWATAQGQDIGDNVGDKSRFPYVATTYRLTEHWQAGAMSRNLPWLAECHPDMFVEISKELAAEKGISNGDEVIVSSARGEIRAVALVTARFKPFIIDGEVIHEVGMPWHYGWQGVATGDSANVLTPHVGDGNTMIPEYKAFLVDIRKA